MRIVSLLLLCFSLAFANVSYAQNHEKKLPYGARRQHE